MKIVCEHCGEKIERYAAVSIDPDWLKKYVEGYYGHEIIFAIGRLKENQRQERKVLIYLMKHFCNMKNSEIEKRFSRYSGYVSDLLATLHKRDRDLKYLIDQLNG